MTKNMLTYGLIMGGILTIQMIITINFCYNNANWEPSEVVGWVSMIVVSSFIFIGVRNYRNKYHDGLITFGKAFKLGAGIAFIAATIYVGSWLIFYYCFIPDFMEKYSQHVLDMAAKHGATAVEMAEKTNEMNQYKEWYKNPILVILMTYMEIFPLGLLVALISALILKRKLKNNQPSID